MKQTILLGLAVVYGAAFSRPAQAWFPQGHSIVAEAATRSLPLEVPAWFRDGYGQIANGAQDPDALKNRALPMASDHEGPDHYLDFELLAGRALPANRGDYELLLRELKLDGRNVGYVPYSVGEWTERLAGAFAESRRYPDNRFIQTKALVYAGILSHYSGDLCMPLHATIDHDGRALPDGTSPKTGIHAKIDSLIERLDLKPQELAQAQNIAVPESASPLLPLIVAEINTSRALIPRTYELEPLLPAGEDWKAGPDVQAFTQERAREATHFTATLFTWAWRRSADVKLPTWMKRDD